VSQPTAPSERRPWRRWRLLLALAGTVAVLVVGVVALDGYRYSAARAEVADAVAETDRLDPGWRFEDLEAQRRLPPAETNAALQLLKVQSLLPRNWGYDPDEDPAWVADVLRELPPERQVDERQARRLREDLQGQAPSLEQARKLADMPEGRYPVAWAADVLSTPCPWSDATLSTPPLLQLDALLRSEDGDPDAALTSARALLNVGRSLGDEPFFRGPLDRSVCRRDASLAVERTLAQGQPSERALAAVQESFAREEAVPLLLPYFRGDRALMHVFLTRVDAGQRRLSEISCVPTRGLGAHVETWLGRTEALHQHARFLHGMNRAVEIAKLPLEQQYPLYREWRRRKGDVENVGGALTLGGWREDILFRDHALLRCALAAVAAERYRREHGDWPQAVADLVPGYLPAVPLDPFDGQPLRYRRTDSGAVIYSVGEDGRDDGGERTPPPDKTLPGDVIFTLWDVAHRRQPPQPPAPPAAGAEKEFRE
jgi:hypothetical protein